jgi:hypothetical protein
MAASPDGVKTTGSAPAGGATTVIQPSEDRVNDRIEVSGLGETDAGILIVYHEDVVARDATNVGPDHHRGLRIAHVRPRGVGDFRLAHDALDRHVDLATVAREALHDGAADGD